MKKLLIFVIASMFLIGTTYAQPHGEIWTGGRTETGFIIMDEGVATRDSVYLDFIGTAVTATSDSTTTRIRITGGEIEGTAVLSTGESGSTKFLREDGDGTSSWQTPSGTGDLLADGSVPMTANWEFGNYDLTLKSITGDGTFSAKVLDLTPVATQAITATTDTIGSTSSALSISSNADYVMGSTPTIAIGTAGQIIVLHNKGAFDVDLQADSVLSGSQIFNEGVDSVIEPNDVVTFMYFDDADGAGNPGWRVQSHPNPTTSAGSAESLDVRNTSGSTIAAFTPVYATGWNAGQARTTVAPADQDDAAKIPAIGVTIASIGNNANGQIITFGEMMNVNTSAFAVDTLLYLSATAGTFTTTRPSVDCVQTMGEVLRSHATRGVFLVTGAGRCNDTDNTILAEVSVTTPLVVADAFDATGAVDMDYGSADITDHTFTSDGGTVILDGKITMGADVVAAKPDTTVTVSSTLSRGEELTDQITDATADEQQIIAGIATITGGSATQPVNIGSGGKGTISLLEGTYNIADTVNTSEGIIIKGVGPSTALFAVSGLDKDMFCVNESTDNPTAAFMFQDLWLEGNEDAGTQTNTSAFDSKCGSVAGWDVWWFRNYLFNFKNTVLDFADPWGQRIIQNTIEDSTGRAIDIDKGASKTTGTIIALNKIIQNDTAVTLNGGLQGNIIALNELNATVAGGYAIDHIGADYTIDVGNSTFGGVHGNHYDATADSNVSIGHMMLGMSGSGFTIDSGASENKIAFSQCVNTGTGGTCITDNGHLTMIWGVSSDQGEASMVTQKMPYPVVFNSGSVATVDTKFNSGSVTSMLAIIGASDQVRLGDSEGSNYALFDADGDLQFAGTADYLVASDDYIWRAVAAANAGPYLQVSGGNEYQWKDTNGNVVFKFDLDDGNTTIGEGAAVDISITFNEDGTDGVLNWDVTEDDFDMNGGLDVSGHISALNGNQVCAFSDGDDKSTCYSHNDTNAFITSSSGHLYLTPGASSYLIMGDASLGFAPATDAAETLGVSGTNEWLTLYVDNVLSGSGAISFGNENLSTTGKVDLSGGELEILNANGDVAPNAGGEIAYDEAEDQLVVYDSQGGEVAGEAVFSPIRKWGFTVDPGAWYDISTEIFLTEVGDEAPNGVIIDEWKCSCNVSPDVEVAAELRYRDAWIGTVNTVTADTVTTVAGVSSEDTDANINSGSAFPNGKVVHIAFTADPEGTCVQYHCDIWHHAEED